MRDEKNRAALLTDLVHLVEALLLEGGIADRQHLVHHQNLRLEMRGHREREPDVHSTRVPLDGGVDELRHA